MQLLTFKDYLLPTLKLAQELRLPLSLIKLHHFPDGESCVQLPQKLDPHLILIRSLNQPNEKLIELLLSCETARSNGAKRITLVTPYLCYMRQDTAFHQGESVSQQIIGKLLAEMVDDLITVDPHLHRTTALQQAVPCHNAINLNASECYLPFIKEQQYQLLVGPDSESEQWVKILAEKAKINYAIGNKLRRGDRDVSVSLSRTTQNTNKILILDDMISTGNTIAECAKTIQTTHSGQIDCLCTHALYSQEAAHLMKQAGVRNLYSSDSLVHPSNHLSLSPLLASALKGLFP